MTRRESAGTRQRARNRERLGDQRGFLRDIKVLLLLLVALAIPFFFLGFGWATLRYAVASLFAVAALVGLGIIPFFLATHPRDQGATTLREAWRVLFAEGILPLLALPAYSVAFAAAALLLFGVGWIASVLYALAAAGVAITAGTVAIRIGYWVRDRLATRRKPGA